MKYFFLFLLLPSIATAQLIRKSAQDTGRRWIVVTMSTSLKTGTSQRVDAAFQTMGADLALQLSGTTAGNNTVLVGDRLILLLDGDSTVTLRSPQVQTAERRGGTSVFRHNYLLQPQDLFVISRHELKGLRKYSAEGYEDFFVDATAGGKLRELSTAFVTELQKHAVLSPPASPTFPGGKTTLLRFFNRNLKPVAALEGSERRFGLARFAVGADGTVTDFAIAHSAGAAFDAEIMRLLKRMPNWKPATANGKAVATTVTQPFTFLRSEGKMAILF